VEPIRDELENQYSHFERVGQGLPLLDSFIKESARLTPVESSMKNKMNSLDVVSLLTDRSEHAPIRTSAIHPFGRHGTEGW
jgi:hypothetical protein